MASHRSSLALSSPSVQAHDRYIMKFYRVWLNPRVFIFSEGAVQIEPLSPRSEQIFAKRHVHGVMLKRKPCYTAEQTVTHEDLSSSSFKEHSLGRANQAAFFSSQGS